MKRNVYLLLFSLFLVAAGCKSDPASPPPEQENGAVIVDNTIIADAATRAAVEVADSTRIVLTGSQLVTAKAGDFLASDVSDAAPYGFLVKIKSRKEEGGKTILEVEDAKLTDVIISGKLKETVRLGPNGVVARASGKQKGILADELFKLSGDTTIDGFKFEAEVTFAPSFTLDWEFENSAIKVFEYSLDQETKSMLTVSSGGGKLEKEWEWFKKHLPPIRFAIPTPLGPLPVVLRPTFVIGAKLEGELDAIVKVAVGTQTTERSGRRFEFGSWKDINIRKDSLIVIPPKAPEITFTGKGAITGGLHVGLYSRNLLNAKLEGEIFGKAKATTEGDTLITISAGTEVKFDLDSKIMDNFFNGAASFEGWKLFEYEKILWAMENLKIEPKPLRGEVNKPLKISTSYISVLPVRYRFTFGDGSPVEVGTETFREHTYDSIGNYDVLVEVLNLTNDTVIVKRKERATILAGSSASWTTSNAQNPLQPVRITDSVRFINNKTTNSVALFCYYSRIDPSLAGGSETVYGKRAIELTITNFTGPGTYSLVSAGWRGPGSTSVEPQLDGQPGFLKVTEYDESKNLVKGEFEYDITTSFDVVFHIKDGSFTTGIELR